jgi:hypothetical protein
MIIRVFCHTLSILNLISIQFKIFDKKFQEFEDDYIRFLICIFNLFVFEPIFNIIQTFFIIFYIILFLLNYFFFLFFIKIPAILLFFLILQPFNLTYLFVEIIYMFITPYIFYFKYPLLVIKGALSKDIPEFVFFDSADYKVKKKNMSSPDLKVYYPMKFALSSVLIRVTGVILSFSFLFIFFFSFFNIFITGNVILGDFDKIFPLKIINFFSGYIHIVNEDYYDASKYNNKTFYSTIKCILILMYTYFSICYKYLYYDFVIRFAVASYFTKLPIIFYFSYILFIKLFICILPIHIYYVINHSYRIISISKYINYMFFYLKLFIKYLFQRLIISFKKLWEFVIYIAKAEDKPL